MLGLDLEKVIAGNLSRNGFSIFWREMNHSSPDYNEQEDKPIERGSLYFQALMNDDKPAMQAVKDASDRENGDIYVEMLQAFREKYIGFTEVPCLTDKPACRETQKFREFCEHFKLIPEDVFIAKTLASGEDSGLLAAEVVAYVSANKVIRERLKDVHSIGLSGGVTIMRLLELARSYHKLSSTTFVAMMAETDFTDTITHHPANSLAALGKNRFPGSKYIRLPNESSNSALATFAWSDLDCAFLGVTAFGEMVNEFLKYGEQAPDLLVDINAYFTEEKKELEAVGLLLHNVIDIYGQPIKDFPGSEQIHGISLRRLLNMHNKAKIFLVAGGEAKKFAVLGALNTKCFTGLVVDESIWNYLIDNYKTCSTELG